MQNTLIYLIGFAGTGKLTTAKAICEQLDAHLVDNHYINNTILNLIHTDGSKQISKAAYQKTDIVRQAVLETIAELSCAEDNFVFTNMLLDEDPNDHRIYEQVKAAAKERAANFVPVRLYCALEENKKRIIQPERAGLCKEADTKFAEQHHSNDTIIQISHPNLLDLDNTALAPDQAAAIILKHAQKSAHPAPQKTAPDPR